LVLKDAIEMKGPGVIGLCRKYSFILACRFVQSPLHMPFITLIQIPGCRHVIARARGGRNGRLNILRLLNIHACLPKSPCDA
jgi:hypothetical protein